MTLDSSIEIPIQINGKNRSKIVVARATSSPDLETAAKADPKVAEWLEGKAIKKAIVVPDRLVHFVVG